MPRIHVADVPEFAGIIDFARGQSGIAISAPRNGYVTISSSNDLVIDRRGCGFKPAVWYTCLSGGVDGAIVEYGRDTLRISGGSSG